MKKVFLSSLLSIVTILVLFTTSCKKEDEQVYSCNPELNNWATANRKGFQNISRDELAAIKSIDTQHVMYNALSSENKQRIWTEKLKLIKPALNPDEQTHVQLAIDHFQAGDWETNETKGVLNTWAVAWGQTAIINLHWDSTKLFLVAETWLTEREMLDFQAKYDAAKTLEERNGIMNTALVGGGGGGGGYAKNCACASSLACKWFTSTCDDGNCNKTWDCGFFGSSECTGICKDRGAWGGKGNDSLSKNTQTNTTTSKPVSVRP